MINIHITYWDMVNPDPTALYPPSRNIDCQGWEVKDGIMRVWGANAEQESEFYIPLYHVQSWSVRD